VTSSAGREGAATPAGLRLGPLERAVLDYLWSADTGADVATVHAAVGAPRRLASNTIQSTLERLVRKRLLSRRRRGRAYEYAPTITRAAWIGTLLDAVAEGLGDGERAELLAGFVDFADRASDSTLEALDALVRARLRERGARGED